MNTLSSQETKKSNKWTKFIQKTLFGKQKANIQEKMSSKSSKTWLWALLSGSSKEKTENTREVYSNHVSLHQKAIPVQDQRKDYKDESNSHCSASISDHHEKDIVPLHQFLRYSLSCSDQHKFQRRRITQPFKPIYEVEWQKNQWLQLDKTTNKQIEHLRRQGFTKIAVRKDKAVKKHIKYDNPNEIDVLLELSLYTFEDDFSKILYDQTELITCHQPNYFTLRRIRWWHTYKSGEARLPNWIDQDLCCDHVMMDAHSVMAAMTNYSRSSVSSFHHPRLPDTPLLSQKSSLSQLRPQNQDDSWRFKSLQYSEPHILKDKSVNVST